MSEIIRTVDIPFLDGTTRTVLMNMSARIEAEGAMPQPDGTPTPFLTIANMDGLTPLRVLLWAGMRAALRADDRKAEAAKLTLDDVTELLGDINSNELWMYLTLATVVADKHSVTTEDQRKNAERATMDAIEKLRQPASMSSDDSPSGPAN